MLIFQPVREVILVKFSYNGSQTKNIPNVRTEEELRLNCSKNLLLCTGPGRKEKNCSIHNQTRWRDLLILKLLPHKSFKTKKKASISCFLNRKTDSFTFQQFLYFWIPWKIPSDFKKDGNFKRWWMLNTSWPSDPGQIAPQTLVNFYISLGPKKHHHLFSLTYFSAVLALK